MTLIIFSLYVLVILLIGWAAAARGKQSGEDIHLAGRSVRPVIAAISSGASTESGFVLLGMVGAGFAVGVSALWIVPAGLIGYGLLWILLAPRLSRTPGLKTAI